MTGANRGVSRLRLEGFIPVVDEDVHLRLIQR
jgi:hypothetical protein